ncbi:MAG: flagellar motor switch protein FliN [Pseudobdellovibrionaceae bacterium]
MADNLDSLAEKLAAEAEAADPSAAGGGAGDSPAAPTEADLQKDRNLALILDIPLRVTVELGRTKMPVNELLNLGQGSVLELNKLAGEPMEVFVNDKLIARGEAVVVNEKFGVRLTDIISTKERVEQLK